MPSEAEAQGAALRTVKNCPPFIEAMTCGYIIPLVAEITLTRDSAGRFHGQANGANILHFHRALQVKGAPFENLPVVKILNPLWLIRDAAGALDSYSCLF